MAVKKTPYARGKGGSGRQGQKSAGASAAKRSAAHPVRSTKKRAFLATEGFKKGQAAVIDTVNSLSFTTKIVIGLVMAAVAVTCLVSLTKSQLTINEKQQMLDELDAKIARQKLDNDELEDRLNGDLDQYIEAYAREKLDMVKPGERVYINTVGD